MNLFLTNEQKEEIGFNYLLSLLEVNSYYGKQYLNNLPIFSNENILKNEFDKIDECIKLIEKFPNLFIEIEVIFSRIKNLGNIVNNLSYLNLDVVEIFEVKRFIYNVNKLYDIFCKFDTNLFELNEFYGLYKFLDLDNSNQVFFHIYNDYHCDLENARNSNNNDLISKIESEVRKMITKEILRYQEQLESTINYIGYLEVLIAKSRLAYEYKLNRSEFGSKIRIVDGYNPSIKSMIMSNNCKYQNLDIDLECSINVITGSNMSGKSVSLKCIIFNLLCFHYGFYCFASKTVMKLYDYIIYINDELQSIQNSLSSFGAEINVLNKYLPVIKDLDGIIILDEFARGTNPYEGRNILAGLLKFIKYYDRKIVVSTHLDLNLNIDYCHFQTVGLSKCDVESITNSLIIDVMDYSIERVSCHTNVVEDANRVLRLLNIDDELYEFINDEYKEGS